MVRAMNDDERTQRRALLLGAIAAALGVVCATLPFLDRVTQIQAARTQ